MLRAAPKPGAARGTRQASGALRRGLRHAVPYLFLLPSAALVVGVLLVPVLKTLVSAFSEFNLIGQTTGFNGVENFRSLFADPTFPRIIRQTLIWTVAITVVATPISVGLALVLNGRFTGRTIARAIVFAPWAISFVYVAIIWRFILDPFYGHFNSVLDAFGVGSVGTPWLGRPTSALVAVIAVGVQLTIPFTTTVTLAGLQSLPTDVVDAARMDGAAGWRMLRHITLPLIRPVLTVATLVNVIYIFNSFPIVWVMTQGGPSNATDTVVTYVYKLTFGNNQYGEGAVLSMIAFVILMLFSFLYVRFAAREEF
jgi:multiple sugar transport system permease protein